MRLFVICLIGILINNIEASPSQVPAQSPSSPSFGFSNSTSISSSLQNHTSSGVLPSHPEGGSHGNVTISHLPVVKRGGAGFSKINVPIGRFHQNAVLPKGASTTQSMTVSGSSLTNVQAKVAQTTIQGFDGLNQQQSRGYSPPDVQMAVGPNDVVEVVNSEMSIFSKSGGVIQSISLDVFFNLPSTDNISDPKILYDYQSGRWFASMEDFTTGKVYLAVSSSNDPTMTWSIYWFTFSYFPDQPTLGLNDDKIALSVNDYDSSSFAQFQGSQFIIIDKNNILSGSLHYQFSSVITNSASIHPAQSLSSTSVLYMVSSTVGLNNQIALYLISGSVPSITENEIDFSTSTLQNSPPAIQPGTTSTIDTGDTRTLDAAWYQGKLWLVFTDSCTPVGDSQTRSCIHLIQINTTTQNIIQNFDFGSTGYYYFYPAIRIDGSGNLDLIFGYSSSSISPSLAISGQAITDPVNTLEQSVAIKLGSGVSTQTDSSGRVRYGDYFAAAVDPSNTRTVWVAGEYISSNINTIGWSTFISSMSVSLSQTVSKSDSFTITDNLQTSITSCSPPNSGDWILATSCALVNSVSAHANVVVQPGVVLTIPNGLRLNIDFTHYHLLVKSGGGVLIKAGGEIN